MTTTTKIPGQSLLHRVPPRMIIFALVAGLLLGFPAYVFLHEKLTGGIVDHGDYVEVDLKAMSTFEFDQDNGKLTDVPEKWRALDGKRVLVTGEIWQPREADGRMSEFQLVYSIAKCCFSGAPKIQHFVQAKVNPGKTVEYSSNLVRVMGTLRVDVKNEAGKVTQVYALEVESVDPV
jgi:hypothetical protein